MATPAAPTLVGRERELEAINRLTTPDQRDGAVLVLEGPPGIGKTSLLEYGVALGRGRGQRVLLARASGAETGLPFATLIDLLDRVAPEELEGLPPPQLRALNVALYRAEPTGSPPEPHAIALGLLSALRDLAAGDHLLVAIDDLQWLDRASGDALAYAARRLDLQQVSFLCARRPGEDSVLEHALPVAQVHRLRLEPVGLHEAGQILGERLGLQLPRQTLRRVYDSTLGNPLFTLEVGRVLAATGVDALEEVPVPDQVDELLGLRVADLDPGGTRALLALALDSDLRVPQVLKLVGQEAFEAAVEIGVVVIEDERVRPAHPLLAAVARNRSTEVERSTLHLELATLFTDEQHRALHLALATSGEDEELANRVAQAADRAAARGASVRAVELATHALRLTPPEGKAVVERVLRLGDHLKVAGEKQRVTDLVSEHLDAMPRGAARVAAYLLLTNGVIAGNDTIRDLLEKALAEAGEDAALRAPVLAQLAENESAVQVERIAQAVFWGEEALASLGPEQHEQERVTLYGLSWARSLAGSSVDDLCERFRVVCDEGFYLAESPERVAGQRLVWRGEVDRARDVLTRMLRLADERGEPSSYALQRLHLCELELRVGAWDEAQRLLDEWAGSTDSALLHWPMYERCRALLAAGRGEPEEARRWGGEALRRADATGVRWDWLEGQRALGQAALLAKDFPSAVRHFGAVWEHTEREGVADPGTFPVAADLVEALAESGNPERGREIAERLAERGRTLDHSWARVGAQRSEALVELAQAGYVDRAVSALTQAASAYEDLGLRFEQARTLLVLGRAQRRAKKWGAAREHLELAVAAFETMGSNGWAEDARSELGRVGARRPAATGELTSTERRVAELAREGLSNKEIARSLVVTVNTVEFHLRNAYAKLGIRSRAQLAARLDPGVAPVKPSGDP